MEIIPFENMKYQENEICIDDTSIDYVQSNDCTEEDGGTQSITISSRNNGISRFINIKKRVTEFLVQSPTFLYS